MTRHKPIGVYPTDTKLAVAVYGRRGERLGTEIEQLPGAARFAAYDATGLAWGVSEAEAAQIAEDVAGERERRAAK